MTERDRAKLAVDRMMHDAHLRYQRQVLKADATGMPSTEIRGVKRVVSKREADVVWLSELTTGLRPNFWKAYFETLSFMAK